MEGFCEVVPVWQFPVSVASFYDRICNKFLNILGAYRVPRHISRGYILEFGNVIPSKSEQEVVDI